MKLLSAISVFDHYMFEWCLKRKFRDPMIFLSRWVSGSADGHAYSMLGVIFFLLNEWSLVKTLALGLFVERALYFFLKNYLKRQRPQQAIPSFTSVVQPSDQFSFPSGHTSAAFFMMSVLSTFFPVLLVPLMLWAIAVGISRVILGVHFPTDTFAGAALGYGVSLWVTSLGF